MTTWQEVAELARLVDRDPEAPPQCHATADQLLDLEARLGLQLPEPLTTWLGILNGDTVSEGGVFGARSDEPALDIARVRNIFREEWRENAWLPVASDGCGNYYVLTEV